VQVVERAVKQGRHLLQKEAPCFNLHFQVTLSQVTYAARRAQIRKLRRATAGPRHYVIYMEGNRWLSSAAVLTGETISTKYAESKRRSRYT
jgi:hypothetical protein